MKGRLMLVFGTWAVLIPGVGGLILQEDAVEPLPPVKATEMIRTVAVTELVFRPDRRATNLAEMGLRDPALFAAALDRLKGLDERRDEIRGYLKESKAPIGEVFCKKELAVPYRSAMLLISQEQGAPRVVEIDGRFGKGWERYPKEAVKKLFTKFERYKERQPEDTLIALAALITGNVDAATINPGEPFDKTTLQGGRFATVVSSFAGTRDVEQMLVQYIAQTEFLAEIVWADEAAFGCRGDLKKPK
jgi:hypothetical protein